MIRRHSLKSMSSHAVKGTMAALLTRMSSFPKWATVCSMSDGDLVRVGDVHGHRERTRDLGRRCRGARAVDVRDDDLGALRGELVRDGPADALGAAGDDRDAILELHLVWSPAQAP